MSSLRLVCLSADPALGREMEAALAPFGDAVRLGLVDPENPDPDALAAADALLCGDLPARIRAAAPNLSWVQFWSAGVDGKLTPEIRASGVEVATGSGIHATACSEHVLALMLAFARGLPGSFAAQQRRDWSAREAIGRAQFELAGRTAGIVGAGTIGQAIGVRCQALGMRTVGVRRDPSREAPGIDLLLPLLRYHELVLAADFIVLALPLTPETQMIFGEDEIEICKKSAYVINIGRGGLIDERYLVQALGRGWMAGAGLDVFADEPLPPDSPFWTLPNCIVTPHLGGNTPAARVRLAALVAEQVGRRLRGDPLLNRVDPTRGY